MGAKRLGWVTINPHDDAERVRVTAVSRTHDFWHHSAQLSATRSRIGRPSGRWASLSMGVPESVPQAFCGGLGLSRSSRRETRAACQTIHAVRWDSGRNAIPTITANLPQDRTNSHIAFT